jgi:hypothetical protein
MKSEALVLLENLAEGLSESRGAIPWESGAKAVKAYLDDKHGSKAAGVIGRLGNKLTDPAKAKVRDEVLGLYGTTAEPGNVTKEKKAVKVRPSTKASGKVVREKGTKVEDTVVPVISKKPIKPRKPKPNLANLLNIKRPIHLTEGDQKQIDETMEKVGPSISKRVDSFQQKHPILTKALKGAAIGGVVGVAMAATGGGAALAGVLGGMGGSAVAGSTGAVVATKAAAVLSSSAATTAYATFYGARMGKTLAVHHYIKENKQKKGTFAFNHPYLVRLGML